jgi:predicted DsbA family dithiol-disulfide isomerase/predicted nucleic acid-binding protein
MPFVVDASVALAWNLPDEQHAIAESALKRLESDESLVPALWWFEFRNVLLTGERKGRIDQADTGVILRRIAQLAIGLDCNTQEASLLDLAGRHRLTAYDAARLALAIRRGLVLAISDDHLRRAAETDDIWLLTALLPYGAFLTPIDHAGPAGAPGHSLTSLASTPSASRYCPHARSRQKPAPMNVVAPPRAKLLIEVVHDLVCPWCYLGLRRLRRALRRRPDLLFDLLWRPFLLNPDMPRAGMPRADYVARKFGGEERARRLYGSIAEIGRTEGVAFRFDRIRHTPSSVDAHRIVRWAAGRGRGAEVVEALFSAHFSEGRDIGDPGVLAAIAAGCGLDGVAAQRYVLSDTDCEMVHAENLRAHRLGINGVPCFLIGGRHAIAGAQEPEVLERLLNVAVIEATDG